MSSLTHTPLETLLDELGYGEALRRERIRPPGSSEVLDYVGFTRSAPQDIRTSAIAAVEAHKRSIDAVLAAARSMAAPFALLSLAGSISMYRVGAFPSDDELIQDFDLSKPDEWRVKEFRRALDPALLQIAKTGLRQLTLFPIDARLLEVARHHSVHSLRTRLEAAFAHVQERKHYQPAETARLVITALACVIVRDKYGRGATTPSTMVASALQKHPGYFQHLASWEANDHATVAHVLQELSEGIDYAAVDARSVNSVYEHLFVTPALRKDLGTFYTDPMFATRILAHLPIEELEPTSRSVIDPACGSGNLLLAAQERLDALSPPAWTAKKRHKWLKTHLIGADVDPIAAEIARLSLLVSALPLGNTWRIETTDFLTNPPTTDTPPTLLVTNPPWHNPKGKRADKASVFLKGAVDLIADGGFLACIMPASWLSGDQHAHSRRALAERCEIFEIWRLPRDMFAPDARTGCCVLFARKTETPQRKGAAFRWVKAGRLSRARFVAEGESSFQSLVPVAADGQRLTWGPLEGLLQQQSVVERLAGRATVLSGVVQRGAPAAGEAGTGFPMLLRGARPPIYRSLDSSSVTWLESVDDFVASERRVAALRPAPKLLVQADRNPDTAWRMRPVIDTLGVVPVGAWHALLTEGEDDLFALLAVLASSTVSCWIHTHAVGKRIPVELVEEIPLPSPWLHYREDLSHLGRMLASKGPTSNLMMRLERAVHASYGLKSESIAQIAQIMGGAKAPEGAVRILEPDRPVPAPAARMISLSRSGTVLDVEAPHLRIWINGESEEGQLLSLPTHMPGWLCNPGQTFTLEGDALTGHYQFQRASFLTDDDVFGVVPPHGPDG